jgi:hypothetical protein
MALLIFQLRLRLKLRLRVASRWLLDPQILGFDLFVMA